MNKNTVAIVGRPNTGKSTLFNKIIGKSESITSSEKGTTRDIIIKNTSWQGINFNIFDTGGINLKTKTNLEKNIQLQTNTAIKKAEVILFLINIREGLRSEDIVIANKLKKTKKNVILVANKADNETLREETTNLYKLGLKKPYPISATKGSGIGDLLDKIISYFTEDSNQTKKDNIRVSILGKLNVGKSSLFNALSKDNKVIVSEEEGTTRDSVNTILKYKDNIILINDTAGLRRKSKIKSEIEKISSYKTLDKIKDSDICLFLIDATKKISRQDTRITSRILEKGKSIILIVNKWDLIRSKNKSNNKIHIKKYTKYLRANFSFIYWSPVIFISAKYKENINDILENVLIVSNERNKIIDTELLEKHFSYINKEFYKDKDIKKLGYKLIQLKNNPRNFILYAKNKEEIPSAYIKFIEKELRKKFEFSGVPIRINIKKF